MKKKKIVIVLIIIIIIITIILNDNISMIINNSIMRIVRLNDEPIDKNTWIINNKYFGISSNGDDSEHTTKGINAAIEYASKNNIKYIKLEKGNYLIKGITTNNDTSGIILKSNIYLDLNGSTIMQEKNSSKAYICISIHECEQVTLSNGIIVGDKENHIYDSGTTDEWGHGISIISSKQIDINNIEIYNTTGDGIYISEIYDKNRLTPYQTNQVVIENCNIHNTRRQGISIITGENINIYNNEIHDISGTAPQSGIDLESNNRTEEIKNVIIDNNKFYNFKSKKAIKIAANTNNIKIMNNDMDGSGISGFQEKDIILIANNKIKDGWISFSYKENYKTNQLTISNNQLIDSYMKICNIEKLEVLENQILNGTITIESSNCTINNNKMQNNLEDIIILRVREEDKDKIFKYSSYNNTNNGNETKIIIETIENYQEYINH